MKKTLIALAVAGLSFNAAAVVDFDAASPAVPKFASEIKFDATNGTALVNNGNILDVKTKVGFSISQNNQRYVRFDITGAEFGANGVLAISADHPDFVSTVSSSGKTFVIFEIKDPKAAIAADAVLTYPLSIAVKAGSTVNLTYKLFETAVAAVNNDPAQALYSKSGAVATFTPALLAKKVDTTPTKIDVTLESKKFVGGGLTNVVGKVAVGAATGVLWSTGAQTVMGDLVAAGSKLEITADLSAGKKQAADATKVDVTALKLGAAPATSIDATKATFALAAALGDVNLDPVTTVDVTFEADGKTAMNETTYAAKYLVTAPATATTGDVTIGNLSTVTKNGSTEEANLVLAPDTSYTNLVRISNTSTIAGKFFITVIADDGKSATFPLSDVAGQPASLDAGASTKQMKVADIYAAAEAKGLVLTGDKKLRLKVEGEVGSLSLQNYTVSKDGNALNTMNAF
ncbi:hypothetical protein HQ395_10520 [Aeromonas hydrophila]|uniref:hypothetical protein n=1 Tax=Aeromonas hydrophila TaxID=644 RepID=UPI001C053DCF|nr:hypothetical protein [Aeromonas hydrophila]QWL79164.1 hypothetical protein HQ395_10520 [Aeromonas hydrophila]